MVLPRPAGTLARLLVAGALVLLVAQPADARDRAGALPSAGGHGHSPRGAHHGSPGTGDVAVSVPEVAVPLVAHAGDGVVRVPVLVTRGTPAGHASLVGVVGCATVAPPGRVVWLTCPYAGQPTVTVVVRLEGHRTVTDEVAVTTA